MVKEQCQTCGNKIPDGCACWEFQNVSGESNDQLCMRLANHFAWLLGNIDSDWRYEFADGSGVLFYDNPPRYIGRWDDGTAFDNEGEYYLNAQDALIPLWENDQGPFEPSALKELLDNRYKTKSIVEESAKNRGLYAAIILGGMASRTDAAINESLVDNAVRLTDALIERLKVNPASKAVEPAVADQKPTRRRTRRITEETEDS